MINLQDFIDKSDLFRKFTVDELLFVEFKCPLEEEKSSVWWHNNFFAYVLSGETRLKTPRREYTLRAGNCVFAKKGSIILHSNLQEVFCELLVFVPDHFIKAVFDKYRLCADTGPVQQGDQEADPVIPLVVDEVLNGYFHSLLGYFAQLAPPPETLLKIKFEELVVSIYLHSGNIPLQCYFRNLCTWTKPSIREMMEANFSHNLSLQEFARLCARSLSAFKTEFKAIYQTTPGKWLLAKRLEYSRYLIETTPHNLEEICYLSGFENRSHFSRVFKRHYGLPPGQWKRHEKVL